MSDLTKEEQDHVRAALTFLEIRCGGRPLLAKAIRFTPGSLAHMTGGRAQITASAAVRVARLAQVGIDDLLAGRYPVAGMCPHCGRGPLGDGIYPAFLIPDAPRPGRND
jgi:hypothetical protein